VGKINEVKVSYDNLKAKIKDVHEVLDARMKAPEPTVPNENFEALEQEAKKLIELAKALNYYRTVTDSYREKITKEEREKWQNEFKGSIQAAVTEMDKSYREMKEEL